MKAEDILKQSGKILLSYSDLFEESRTEDDLICLLKQYPLEQWLNFLSRIQLTIVGDKASDIESQRTVVKRIFPQRFCDALTRWCKEHPKIAESAVVASERQTSILQELAIVHAPEELQGRAFEKEEDFAVLTEALLAVSGLMNEYEDKEFDDIIGVTAHMQANYKNFPSWKAYPRALKFYEIEEEHKSDSVLKYGACFSNASGCEIDDFVLGGICFAMQEEPRSSDEILSGWHAVRTPELCVNDLERQAVSAFSVSRVGTVAEIRKAVLQFERNLKLRDFNLIPLARYPVVRFEDGRTFVLNISALGRSLFDGPRHIVTTASLRSERGELERAGGLYGEVFEAYTMRCLKDQFGDRVIKIPETIFPGNADCLVLSGNSVIVMEIKSEHFVARDHCKFMSVEERLNEIGDTGITRSVSQICRTVGNLRKGIFSKRLDLPAYDWTVTSIVPLIVTDEEFPFYSLLWEPLYKPLEAPLRKMNDGAGYVARLRLLSVDDIEMLRDVSTGMDFSQLLMHWGNDPTYYEVPLKTFIFAKNIKVGNEHRVKDLKSAFRYLSSRLGLDPNDIKN